MSKEEFIFYWRTLLRIKFSSCLMILHKIQESFSVEVELNYKMYQVTVQDQYLEVEGVDNCLPRVALPPIVAHPSAG